MIKIFWAFVKKESFHIIRDSRTLAILLGMPIALVLIFGYTVTNEFKDASIGVLNEAQDELSRELVDHLTASGHFNLVLRAKNIQELENGFKSGSIKFAVVIPNGFQQDYYDYQFPKLQLIADASEPNYATTLRTYAQQMIRSFHQNDQGFNSENYNIMVTNRMWYNPDLISAYTFIPGVVGLILMLISAMMTSLTLAKEKETGTMDLLLISPLPPILILFGKVTPYILVSFINALVIFAMGNWIFDVPIHGSLPLLLALCLLYLLVSLGLGVLISTKSASQQTAMMISLFTLMMPTMLLSGFLFPIDSMPWFLRQLSAIIPANYFIQIQQAIMLKGAGWEVISRPTLILAIMALVLFGASWRSFKIIYK